MTRQRPAVGVRIRRFREERDLSQAQLAAQLGRTATSISYWESGMRTPGLDDVIQLAGVLGVAPSVFLPSPEAPRVAEALARQLALADLPALVDKLSVHARHKGDASASTPTAVARPAEIAEYARDKGGQAATPVALAPIALEFGVALVEHPMPGALAGLVVRFEGCPVIGVRRQDTPVRRRFSAARLLGHVLLGHLDVLHLDMYWTDGFPSDYDWKQERAASDFASALLMPAQLLRHDLESGAFPEAAELAPRYQVSEQAIAIRLSTLGLMS